MTATVGIESGGAGKTMRIHIVQLLDNWPAIPPPKQQYSRNGFKQAASPQDITLTPGGTQSVTRTLTIDAESASRPNDLRFVAWAQSTNASYPSQVYQAAVRAWPFEHPRGDLDGDFAVTINDVDDFVLALVNPAEYQILHPDLDPLVLGDVNQDGYFDGRDIQNFMPLFIDMVAPTPNPMTFAYPPVPAPGAQTSRTQMYASAASDPSTPVTYQFEEVTGNPGGSGTGWVTSVYYSDGGLNPNTQYGYRVHAKDGVGNIGQWSTVSYATTYALVPGAPILGGATQTTMTLDVVPDSSSTQDNPAWTEYAIHCNTQTSDGTWSGKFVAANGGPSATAVWQTDAAWNVVTITGLQPNTLYYFEVKARNTLNVETNYSAVSSLATPP